MQIFERQLAQIYAGAVGMAHGQRHHFVAVAERHAFFHQIIGQIGGGGKTLHHGCAHVFGLHGNAAHHVGINAQGVDQRVYRVKQRLFVFLVVFIVGQGLRFHQHHQAGEVADHAAGFAAHQFGHIGVFLLRHDAGAGAEAVGNVDKAEAWAHP